jgi:prepilin-type N-terminal cleavage/methylation domain-containing protein
MSRIGSKSAFTLVEVMIAASVLAIGTVGVYQSFFMALDTSNYSRHYLDVATLADGLFEETLLSLEQTGERAVIPSEGDFLAAGRPYHWLVASSLQDEAKGLCKLFRIDVNVFWKEGRRKAGISRSGFALYKEQK